VKLCTSGQGDKVYSVEADDLKKVLRPWPCTNACAKALPEGQKKSLRPLIGNKHGRSTIDFSTFK
jgi:hypothetical protein